MNLLTSQDVGLLKLAFRHFFLLDNSTIKPDNKVLMDNLILTFLHKLYCPKQPLSCTIYYYLQQHLILLYFYIPIFIQWYLALAMICEKYCRSSTFVIIRVYKLVYLLNIKFKNCKEFHFQLPVIFDLGVFTIQSNFIVKNIDFWFNAFIVGILSIVKVFIANN